MFFHLPVFYAQKKIRYKSIASVHAIALANNLIHKMCAKRRGWRQRTVRRGFLFDSAVDIGNWSALLQNIVFLMSFQPDDRAWYRQRAGAGLPCQKFAHANNFPLNQALAF